MRQLAAYFEEREGFSCVQMDEGFAVYRVDGDTCYLRDIWVERDYRKKGIATDLADRVAALARTLGCRYMTGSVDLSLPSATQSIKVLLAYGMIVTGAVGNGLYFKKEL
jgi:GNAT superfamily N-acetyltransferase